MRKIFFILTLPPPPTTPNPFYHNSYSYYNQKSYYNPNPDTLNQNTDPSDDNAGILTNPVPYIPYIGVAAALMASGALGYLAFRSRKKISKVIDYYRKKLTRTPAVELEDKGARKSDKTVDSLQLAREDTGNNVAIPGLNTANLTREQLFVCYYLFLVNLASVARFLPKDEDGTPKYTYESRQQVIENTSRDVREALSSSNTGTTSTGGMPNNIQQEYSKALRDLKSLEKSFGELESKVNNAKGEISESFEQKFGDLQSQIEPMREELAALQDAQNVATNFNDEYESVQTLTSEARSLLQDLKEMKTNLKTLPKTEDIDETLATILQQVLDLSTSFDDRLKKLDSSLEQKYDEDLAKLRERIKVLSTATETALAQTSEHFGRIDEEIKRLKLSLEGIQNPPGNAGAPAARSDLLARIEELEAFLRDSMVAHKDSFNGRELPFTEYRSFKERPQSALRAALGLVISGHSGHSGHSARALWRGRVPCI